MHVLRCLVAFCVLQSPAGVALLLCTKVLSGVRDL